MKDITGKEIQKGDFVFYGVKESVSISYSFALVEKVFEDKVKVLVFKNRHSIRSRLKPSWIIVGHSQIKNAPLIVSDEVVPENIKDFPLVSGLRKNM